MANWADALSGLGAGLQGRGTEWNMMMDEREAQARTISQADVLVKRKRRIKNQPASRWVSVTILILFSFSNSST